MKKKKIHWMFDRGNRSWHVIDLIPGPKTFAVQLSVHVTEEGFFQGNVTVSCLMRCRKMEDVSLRRVHLDTYETETRGRLEAAQANCIELAEEKLQACRRLKKKGEVSS